MLANHSFECITPLCGASQAFTIKPWICNPFLAGLRPCGSPFLAGKLETFIDLKLGFPCAGSLNQCAAWDTASTVPFQGLPEHKKQLGLHNWEAIRNECTSNENKCIRKSIVSSLAWGIHNIGRNLAVPRPWYFVLGAASLGCASE